MNNIGSVYSRMGDKRSALGYYEKALEIMRQFVDDDHQIIETLKNNIEACRY
jgi:tetratricopeptide (TPR) repeat protein